MRRRVAVLLVFAGSLVSVAGASPASAGPGAGELSRDLRRAVDAADLRARLQPLGAIAARSGGNRAAGTVGYKRSTRYVATTLRRAGYAVRFQPFTFIDRGRRRAARNVIANLNRGGGKRVVMVGAHLDSVREGPGANDNGSGVAATLELAVELARLRPDVNVRFAFWGAEEVGLLGSSVYVARLTRSRRARIALYLNLDMVGSSNFVRFVYRPEGSGADRRAGVVARNLLVAALRSRGLASEPISIAGRSDHSPFSARGVPVAGLFSGAEGVKTRRQARRYGGRAGIPFDPCYHLRCDRVGRVSFRVAEELADAAAHALATVAVRPAVLG